MPKSAPGSAGHTGKALDGHRLGEEATESLETAELWGWGRRRRREDGPGTPGLCVRPTARPEKSRPGREFQAPRDITVCPGRVTRC